MISFSGDLDLEVATATDPATLLAPGIPGVVVDLSEVGFLDSSGINLLIKLRLRVEEVGAAMTVVGADAVRSTLRFCGLLEFLGVRAA